MLYGVYHFEGLVTNRRACTVVPSWKQHLCAHRTMSVVYVVSTVETEGFRHPLADADHHGMCGRILQLSVSSAKVEKFWTHNVTNEMLGHVLFLWRDYLTLVMGKDGVSVRAVGLC